MHESIYRFLLESGYPRASIITDPQVLDPGPAFTRTTVERNGPGSALATQPVAPRKPDSETSEGADAAENSDDVAYQPAAMIVDPDTYDRLAVIDIVESDSAEDVVAGGLRALHYAARFSNQHIQSFIMQLDLTSTDSDEKVRFYKLSRQNKILPLPSYAFPDLATLKVTRMMEIDAGIRRDGKSGLLKSGESEGDKTAETSGEAPLLLFFLALVLVLLAVIDWLLMYTRGFGVFTTQQILLFVAAVFLLAVPLLLRVRRP